MYNIIEVRTCAIMNDVLKLNFIVKLLTCNEEYFIIDQ